MTSQVFRPATDEEKFLARSCAKACFQLAVFLSEVEQGKAPVNESLMQTLRKIAEVHPSIQNLMLAARAESRVSDLSAAS